MQMLNLKRSRSQTVSGCYLNISGPVLKRFKDALGLLCVYPVQRPIPQKTRRNNYSSSPAWELVRAARLLHTLSVLQGKLTRRQ